MARKKKESFFKTHKIGLVLASVTVVAGVVVNNIFSTFLAPVQAVVAAKQVEDSIGSWALHHQLSYGNTLPVIVIWGTVLLTLAFLTPAVFHAIKLALKKRGQ